MGRNINFNTYSNDFYKIGDIKESFAIGDGWLPCDGSSYLKSEYGLLANSIGYINRYSWKQQPMIGIDYYSENGIPNTINASDFQFLNNQYVILSRFGVLFVSTNGINWTTKLLPTVPTNPQNDPSDLTFGSALVNPIYPNYNDSDKVSWRKIAYGNGIYLLVSDEYYCTSTDLITWSTPSKFISYSNGETVYPIVSVIYGNFIFMIVSASGAIWTSNNTATDWIVGSIGIGVTTELRNAIYFKNSTDPTESYFIAVGDCSSEYCFNFVKDNLSSKNIDADSVIVYSKDGISWGHILLPYILDEPIRYYIKNVTSDYFFTDSPFFRKDNTTTIDEVVTKNYPRDFHRPIPSDIVSGGNSIAISFSNEAYMLYMYWNSFYPADQSLHPFKLRYNSLPLIDDWGPIVKIGSTIDNFAIVSKNGNNSLIRNSGTGNHVNFKVEKLPALGRYILSVGPDNVTLPNFVLNNYSTHLYKYTENYDMNTHFSVPKLNTDDRKFIIKYR